MTRGIPVAGRSTLQRLQPPRLRHCKQKAAAPFSHASRGHNRNGSLPVNAVGYFLRETLRSRVAPCELTTTRSVASSFRSVRFERDEARPVPVDKRRYAAACTACPYAGLSPIGNVSLETVVHDVTCFCLLRVSASPQRRIHAALGNRCRTRTFNKSAA